MFPIFRGAPSGLLRLGVASVALCFVFSFRVVSALEVRDSQALVYPPGESLAVELKLEVEVAPDGEVVDARIVSKSPETAPEAFDAAAVDFARSIQFEPLESSDPVLTEITLDFVPPTEERPELPGEAVFVERVRGTRVEPAGASDFQIRMGPLRDVPRSTAAAMLTLAPGVFLVNHGGEGHAPSVFLRGFDAGEGEELAFRLEGMPLNDVSNPHGHGYSDTSFIIPELVTALRVTEGPFDPAQGDFAVAGSVEYELGLGERGVVAKVTRGSYDKWRGVVLYSPEGGPNGTFAGVELRRSEGFGRNRKSAGASAMARYESQFGANTTLSLLGQSYVGRFQSAGVLREDDFQARRLGCAADADSQFFCSYDENQGGQSSRHGVSARLVRKFPHGTLSQQAFISTRRQHLKENFTGFTLDSSNDGLQRGDLSEKLYDATTFGLAGSLLSPLGAHRFEVGYEARYDRGHALARRLDAREGIPYRLDLDHDFNVGNVGVYLGTRFKLTERLSLRAGLRFDAYSIAAEGTAGEGHEDEDEDGNDAHEHEGVGSRRARDAFGIVVEPRLTMQWQLGAGLDWVTSIGRGGRSSAATEVLENGDAAAFGAVWSAETGLKFARALDVGDGLHAEGALTTYATRVEETLLFDEASARIAQEGVSNRLGAHVSGRVAYAGWLDAQASSTWSEGYLAHDDASAWALTDGERLPYVPRWVNRLDASVRRRFVLAQEDFGWGAALGVAHVGRRPLPLGQHSAPVVTLDASARLSWRGIELSIDAMNLFDARYRESELNYASNFRDPSAAPSRRAARHFTAGPPRMVSLSLALRSDAFSGDAR